MTPIRHQKRANKHQKADPEPQHEFIEKCQLSAIPGRLPILLEALCAAGRWGGRGGPSANYSAEKYRRYLQIEIYLQSYLLCIYLKDLTTQLKRSGAREHRADPVAQPRSVRHRAYLDACGSVFVFVFFLLGFWICGQNGALNPKK